MTRPHEPRDPSVLVPEEFAREIRFALTRIAGSPALDVKQIDNKFWTAWAERFRNVYNHEQKKVH